MDASADLVLVNGAVYTVDAACSWAQAVAVKDGRIVAVGSDAAVRERVGPRTEVIDLGGRMLLPGFQDAHAHPPGSGLEMLRCNLSDASTMEEYERLIRAYADEHPDEPWIRGGGWSMDVFPGGTPNKDVLDAIVPDRPVGFPSRDGHSLWVNSAALKVAGITRDTPDPADGRIERDAHGEPSGTLHEGAMELVAVHAPQDTMEDFTRGLLVAQRYLHSLGITAWQDASVRLDGGGCPTFDAYVEAASRGELTARVIGALWWDRHRGEEQIEEIVRARESGRMGRFSPTTVKIMQDGIVENFTAGVLEPYLDADGALTGNRGLSFVNPALLKGYVQRLDALGFQVHFHALAERAVRESLDAVEAARRANGRSDNRHHLAHLQVVHPDDVRRFRELGVVANCQPLWALLEGQMVHLTIPFLGEERSGWQYPFGSLHRAGAVLAFGSDWSVSSPDPFQAIHMAVNRRAPQEFASVVGDEAVQEVFLPRERLDLPTAIRAQTMGSAYVNHLERETGSIEVGKHADLVVVDRDVFAVPVDEIHRANVELTFVEGERVHAAGAFT
jgi:hypothetical protein